MPATPDLDALFTSPRDPSPEMTTSWIRQKQEARAVLERFARGFSAVLLADEVGMGKTYVALCVMARYVVQGEKVLLVLPGNPVLRQKWLEEIQTFQADYLKEKNALRPLLVRDICDMLFSLHDYKDEEPERIRSGKLEPFALLFETWYNTHIRKERKWNAHWPLHEGLDGNSMEFRLFCSHFSRRSIFSFLDGWKAGNERPFRHLYDTLNASVREGTEKKRTRAKNEAKQLLRDLFKNFCSRQSTLSPNIFIITMSTLRQRIRHDAPGMDTMKQYLAGLALYNTRKNTRSLILKNIKALGWAGPEGMESELSRMGAKDLWSLRDLMQDALSRSGLTALLEQKRIDEQFRKKADEIASEIVRTVFRARLKESSINLAVVDEVHNWKNGKSNGASRFREYYADAVAHKLIMSATPFQLHEEELATVFETVCPRGEKQDIDPSLARVKAALGIAQACLHASNDFAASWKNLPPKQQRILNDAENGTQSIGECLAMLRDRPGSDESLRCFCIRALSYRERLRELEEALRPVIIRHVRKKELRAFHCGRDFQISGIPGGARHHSIYPVSGYGTEENALPAFIGMRAQQLLCRHVSETQQVHLLGGINSSLEAFQESWKKPECDDASTRAYVDFFQKILRSTPHAKVEATVKRALDNLRHGKKTLIFCDRLATQKAIGDALRKLTEEHGHGKSLPSFGNGVAEYSLARSLIVAGLCPEPDSRRKKQALEKLKKHALSRRHALFRLADLALAEAMLSGRCSEKARRLLPYIRLLDDEAALSRYLSGKTAPLPNDAPERNFPYSAPLVQADASRLFSLILHGPNIWHAGEGAKKLHADLLRLLCEEAENLSRGSDAEGGPDPLSLADMFLNILQRLSRILPRQAEENTTQEQLANLPRRQSASPASQWQRTRRFLDMLCREQGSILKGEENSSRRTLWRGLEGNVSEIMSINGHTDKEKRSAVCALFNSPCFPDVLICTSIGSEGIDLHKECAEVIHHDLPWNPALLEQRTGRVDRIGSLASRQKLLAVGVPFLAGNYDAFQYAVVLERAQKQEILLGRPSLRPVPVPKQESENASLTPLPEAMLDFLRVDLSVHEA